VRDGLVLDRQRPEDLIGATALELAGPDIVPVARLRSNDASRLARLSGGGRLGAPGASARESLRD